ncbi:uncharacterized protein MONOS_6228 [Monocercomonoides exilis]|uniref:uncharacterized protein n=1 Tax=Monocercomonoides exilis TaxID=2049356 RepID=UPI00355A2F8B|nr:hypothetical protein MONOS_6228 [Monocercomonoides exilis]|eukprot:MONOS_6228.1-p1 / transcript=MONOS_6228.1 / gene=MONOS_6228 / organism=Monocercomonoides_exilis_PA203 / gene_product=unspecified product / transcript_product=unspecified product / location=Mono_scaffold00193:69895-70447(-) / protein_length=96 / sequence_SO=supercontig / SO=protein_coding / is_pseudo=false
MSILIVLFIQVSMSTEGENHDEKLDQESEEDEEEDKPIESALPPRKPIAPKSKALAYGKLQPKKGAGFPGRQHFDSADYFKEKQTKKDHPSHPAQ